MNNVYAVRLGATDYLGMVVFMVAASSKSDCVQVVRESEEYEWLENNHYLTDLDETCVEEYGITSRAAEVMDTYECFE